MLSLKETIIQRSIPESELEARIQTLILIYLFQNDIFFQKQHFRVTRL